MLDLRDNGGGLVSEAQLIASAFLADGPIVTTRGRAVKEQTLRATGDPVVPKAPRRRARQQGHRLGLGDRHRRAAGPRAREGGRAPRPSARASSRRSSSSPTAARWTSPPGSTSRPRAATSAARASRTGKGIIPDVPAKDDPKTRTGRGARPGDGRRGRQVPVLTHAPPRSSCSSSAAASSSASRSSSAAGARPSSARATRAPGAWRCCTPAPRAGASRSRACSGAPTSRATSSRRSCSIAACGARSRPGSSAPPRRPRPPDVAAPRPHRAADLHDRPGHRARLRRRDLLRGARRRALARLGAHRRRLGLRAARRGGRPRGLPPLDVGLRAGRGRADAARGALQRRLLAAPRRRAPGRHRRARAARRARP